MVVVGRLPGTGVPAFLNVRTAEIKRAAATSTTMTPIGAPTEAGTNCTGQDKWTSRPRPIDPRYTKGGRISPKLATSAAGCPALTLCSESCTTACLRGRLTAIRRTELE